MMIYPWLKALHVVAVIVWIGGCLAETGAILAVERGAAGRDLAVLARRWASRTVTPAMLSAWALGLSLALLGGWFPAPWLVAKITAVVLLSAIHGVQSGMLRRLEDPSGKAPVPRWLVTPWAVLLPVVVVVMLVVVKPA